MMLLCESIRRRRGRSVVGHFFLNNQTCRYWWWKVENAKNAGNWRINRLGRMGRSDKGEGGNCDNKRRNDKEEKKRERHCCEGEEGRVHSLPFPFLERNATTSADLYNWKATIKSWRRIYGRLQLERVISPRCGGVLAHELLLAMDTEGRDER